MASMPTDGPGEDRSQAPPPAMTPGYPMDAAPSWQSNGRKTPDHNLHSHPSGSPGPKTPGLSDRIDRSLPDRTRGEQDTRRSGERNRSRQRGGRSASGQQRVCKKCGEPLTGQFVRALDGTFHLDCFKCRVRHKLPLPLIPGCAPVIVP